MIKPWEERNSERINSQAFFSPTDMQAEIKELRAELKKTQEKLKKFTGLPMKYKRMEFNAQL